jgi:hypothetical protein
MPGSAAAGHNFQDKKERKNESLFHQGNYFRLNTNNISAAITDANIQNIMVNGFIAFLSTSTFFLSRIEFTYSSSTKSLAM